MKTKNELLDEIEKLETDRTNYLEADMNSMAKKIEKKIWKIQDQIEVVELEEKIDIKNEIKIYKNFIHYQGLEKNYEEFRNKELKKIEY